MAIRGPWIVAVGRGSDETLGDLVATDGAKLGAGLEVAVVDLKMKHSDPAFGHLVALFCAATVAVAEIAVEADDLVEVVVAVSDATLHHLVA